MYIAALVTAILLARMNAARQLEAAPADAEGSVTLAVGGAAGGQGDCGMIRDIPTDTLKGPAISALLLGLGIGLLGRPESVIMGSMSPPSGVFCRS
jgi:hypothetical protein